MIYIPCSSIPCLTCSWMMRNPTMLVSRCLCGSSPRGWCTSGLPRAVDDHYKTKTPGLTSCAPLIVQKCERFSSTGRDRALLQPSRSERFPWMHRSFVPKQAVFLLCACMHNAYLLEPFIRAGPNPSEENINVLQWIFLVIKIVSPSLKSWLNGIKCHNAVRNSHYQQKSNQVWTAKGILPRAVRFQCKHKGSTCDTWLLYSARKHPGVFALLSLSFSSSVALSIHQCWRVQTSQGPVGFLLLL